MTEPMSLRRNIARSSFFRVSESLVSMGTGLILMPFLLGHLGASDYGLWIAITSITAAFYVFDFGFATSVTRFIADGLGRGDLDATNRTVSTAMLVYLALAGIVLVATIGTTLMATAFVSDDARLSAAQAVILISGCALAIQFPLKAYAGIASYHMRYDLGAIARIVIHVAGFLAVIAAVTAGYSLIAMAWIGMFATILSGVTFVLIAHYLEPGLSVKRKFVSRKMLHELTHFSTWVFLNDFMTIVRRRSSIWIIAFGLGTSAVALYYVALRLVEVTESVLQSALGMTTALFSRTIASEGPEGLRRHFRTFLSLHCYAAAVTFGGFAVFSSSFFAIWMGDKIDLALCTTIAIIAAACYMLSFAAMSLASALVAVKEPRNLSLVNTLETAGSTALVAVCVLFLDYGLIGAVAATVATTAIARLVFLPPIVVSRIGVTTAEFYSIAQRPLLVVIPVAGITYIIVNNTPGVGLLKFLVGVVGYLVGCGLMVMIALKPAEISTFQPLLPARLVAAIVWLRARVGVGT